MNKVKALAVSGLAALASFFATDVKAQDVTANGWASTGAYVAPKQFGAFTRGKIDFNLFNYAEGTIFGAGDINKSTLDKVTFNNRTLGGSFGFHHRGENIETKIAPHFGYTGNSVSGDYSFDHNAALYGISGGLFSPSTGTFLNFDFSASTGAYDATLKSGFENNGSSQSYGFSFSGIQNLVRAGDKPAEHTRTNLFDKEYTHQYELALGLSGGWGTQKFGDLSKTDAWTLSVAPKFVINNSKGNSGYMIDITPIALNLYNSRSDSQLAKYWSQEDFKTQLLTGVTFVLPHFNIGLSAGYQWGSTTIDDKTQNLHDKKNNSGALFNISLGTQF